MPLTYPASAAAFFDLLPVRSITFTPSEQLEVNRSSGGEQFTADLGTRLWGGTVTLGRMTRAETVQVEALIDVMRQAGRSFMIYDKRYPTAQDDPGGTILSAASPTIGSNLTDRRLLQVFGLPAGFTLKRGDMMAFDYGSPTVRRALHRIVEGGTADGSGNTPDIEVMPAMRPGNFIGTALNFIRPACKAVMVAGSVQMGTTGHTITDGMAFDFIQTLR
jgi:hypothetical protein